MRPRLRDDVRYVRCDEGAYVHADHGACTLKGAQAHDWLDRLAPYLTGEHTLAELTADLPPDRRRMVADLVQTLAGQGFVIDASDEEPHGLGERERQIYAAEIAFVRHRLSSAERRFERLRQARVTLAGHGPVLAALLEAGLVSGWRQVRVVAPAEEIMRLEETAARARRDEDQRVRVDATTPDLLLSLRMDVDTVAGSLPGSRVDADTAGPLRVGADVVLQVGTEVAELIATARTCPADVALGQVLLRPAEAWIVGPGPAASALSCWRRLAGLPFGDEDEDEDGANLLTGPVPVVLAAQVALSCFAHLTGLAQPSERPAATRVDLRTLETHRHRIVPWTFPVQHGEAELRATVERLQASEPITPEALLERAKPHVDPRTGLLGTLDEEDLVQVPVSVCRAVISNPHRVSPGWVPPPQVVGWGRDRRTARLRALLAACATYGTLAAEATGATTFWGLEPLTGRTRRLPLTSHLTEGPRRPGAGPSWAATPAEGHRRPPVGAGAGLSWAAALAAGLRSHAEALLRAHITSDADADADTGRESGPAAGPEADPATDAEAAHLLHLLRTAGERPEIRDFTSVLRLPAYAVACGSAVSVACATTPVQALRDALERALLAWQARTARQPAYADPAPPWWVEEEEPEWKVLAEALREAGYVPVVTPLHHDPAAAELLPYVVRVVLCDD
ncbi:hypothetical protein AB0F17_52265 [Nonomuraea sp. NPDC026600]|uniref:hypothetical protein n=1 Tax=Nonomuraea sp. NPDC026600 TaxID=3155363 RepID=UPI0033DD6FFB